MSESSDTDNDSDDEFDPIDVYSMDLFDRAATASDIREKIRGHPTFVSMRSFAENDCCLLNAEQIDTALDVRHVNWDDFHTKVLESIVEHKGKNKTSATRNAAGHVNKCTELKKAISRNNTPEFARKSEHHLTEWRSAVFTFACLFIEELERSANKAIDDLSKKIDAILATAWEPLNDIHAETIYYIVGAMLEAATQKMEDKRTSDTLRHSLGVLIKLQSCSKEESTAAGAPTRRVADREAVSLRYASNELYGVVCKYESVFRAVLNDDDIQMHGEGVLRAVSRLLSQKDVGLKDLLDTWADENEVTKLSVFLLNYYTGLRGKDFVKKQNAQVVRTGETHRATIGVIHDLRKKEHANARAAEKESNEEHEGHGGGDGEDSPSMSMLRDQLVALCKQYGLPYSG